MKDMFYNYEHNINHKSYPSMIEPDEPKELNVCDRARILKNVKGDELGVVGKVNSKFFLYFDVTGEVTDENGFFLMPLRDVLEASVLHFDVLGAKREVIASFQPELCEFANEIRVQIFTSEEGPLKYGTYRMHLYFENEEGIYTLFSEEEGILSIE